MASDANLQLQQQQPQQQPSPFPPETPPSGLGGGSYLQQHDQLTAPQHQQQQQFAQQQQQQFMQQQYPGHPPSTPLSHASPQQTTSPNVKISPDTIASLTSGVLQAGSPFSGGGSIISPTGSSFSAGHLSDPSGGLPGDGAGFTRSAAMALAGAMGMSSAPTMAPQAASNPMSLGMDVDLATFATPPHSGPSSTGGSTPSNGSGPPYYAFPPPTATSSMPAQLTQSNLPPPSHPAPTLASAQRHHPYAHPSRPGLTSSHSQTSISGLPHYLSTSAGPSPASSAGPTPSPGPQPAATPEGPADGNGGGNFGLGLPTLPPPQAPHRVHSAPAHILALSTSGLDPRGGSPHPSADPESSGAQAQHRFINGIEQQPLSAVSMGDGSNAGDLLHMSTNSAPSVTTPGLAGNLAPPFGGNSGGGGGGGSGGSGGALPLTIDTLQASKVMSSLSAPQSAPATTMDEDRSGAPGAYNDSVKAAISLLQKRLPIMGAALSTSEIESGQDEEEIWKGIEGAYEELKRIMRGRKDTRRQQGMGSASSKVCPVSRAGLCLPQLV